MPAIVESPWLRVRSVAFAFRDFTEVPPNTNRGQVVDRLVQFSGAPLGSPWCACNVLYMGWYGLYDPIERTSTWPLPKTAGCVELGDFAKQKKVLMATPQEGDVFLLYYLKLGRFAHTGFVVSKNSDGSWMTIEGNTSKPGDTDPATQREGWGVFVRNRTFGPNDKFVRWLKLLP